VLALNLQDERLMNLNSPEKEYKVITSTGMCSVYLVIWSPLSYKQARIPCKNANKYIIIFDLKSKIPKKNAKYIKAGETAGEHPLTLKQCK
jgi:hypothetical protein